MSLMMALGRRMRQRQPGDVIDYSAFPILKLLSHQGPMRLSALAQVLGLDASTVSRHARQLEDRGLLERTEDPDDGRASRVAVSERGQRLPGAGASRPAGTSISQRPRRLVRRRARDPARPARTGSSRPCSTHDPTTPTTPTPAPHAQEHLRMTPDSNGYLSHQQILVVMGGLMAGMFLAALDQSIVGTALPRITSDLGGLDKLSWVVTAYLLDRHRLHPAVGQDLRPLRPPAAVPDRDRHVPGRLAARRLLAEHRAADRVPRDPGPRRRRPDGAGAWPPSATSSRRASAAATRATSPRSSARRRVLGPVLGGFFADGPGWQWIFFINIPIGLVALVVTSRRPEDAARTPRPHHRLPRRRRRRRLGVARSCSTPRGPAPTTAGRSGHRARAAGRRPRARRRCSCWSSCAPTEPIIPMRLFRNSIFSIANLFGFLIGIAMFGVDDLHPGLPAGRRRDDARPSPAWPCCRWWSASSPPRSPPAS